jgi:TolB-like protein/Flp pilus assembly protein TadD
LLIRPNQSGLETKGFNLSFHSSSLFIDRNPHASQFTSGPEMNLSKLFTELKRRNVYKVAAAYAVVGWLLIQVATQVFPFLGISNWAIRLVILLTALGFPVALLVAWAFELTPEGIKRTEDADAARQSSRGGLWIAVVVVAAALSLGLFFLGRYTAARATPRQSDAVTGVLEKSIAVLPLVNTSGDASNEYFSDGLSEDLIAVLAKIPELKVIGRSSSFFFKGKSGDSAAIGQKLGVANLIEGSVRKQGGRVRIVAELISAADGRSLWTETYDRELKDVFAVQAEIAKSVAEQMKVKLLGEAVRSDAASSQNTAAHNAVLQSDFYFQQQTAESIQKAISFAQEAVRLDPNYALAYAKLSQAWRQFGASFSADNAEKAYEEARLAAEKAVSLAPDMVEVRKAIGWISMTPALDFRAAEKEFRRALELSPGDAGAKNALSYSLMAQGRLAEAEQACREAILLDPLLTTLWYNLGRLALAAGRYQDAEDSFSKGLEIQPRAARFHNYLATLKVLEKDPTAALQQAQLEPDPFWREYALALVQQTQPDRSAADSALRNFSSKYASGGAYQIAVICALRKEPDEMFRWLDNAYATHDSGLTQLVITPFFFEYRDDQRFVALCQKLGTQSPAGRKP